MRVVCNLQAVLDAAEMRPDQLRHLRDIDIDPRTAQKICSGSPDWRLTRDQLFGLVALADEFGLQLFEVHAPDIWRTFEKSTARIFRSGRPADAIVETHIRKFFQRISCTARLELDAEPAVVEKAVQSENCVVIGAPIANPSSEIALAVLSELKPFDASPENIKKAPIQFSGRPTVDGRTSAFVVDSASHSVSVRRPSKMHKVAVDWLDSAKAGPGRDAAAVVARTRRTDAGNDITTVVIGGYRGQGTIVACKALTTTEVPITSKELETGEVVVAVYEYRFRKRAAHTGRHVEMVSPEPSSGRWFPPWGS